MAALLLLVAGIVYQQTVDNRAFEPGDKQPAGHSLPGGKVTDDADTVVAQKSTTLSGAVDIAPESPVPDLKDAGARQGYHSRFGPLPESLKGTQPPAGLLVDEEGNIVPTPLMVDLFDYFLTIVGEESLDTVAERVLEHMARHLQEPALGQAVEIFNNYLMMKQAIIDASEQMKLNARDSGRTLSYTEILRNSQEIRLAHLGQVVYDAFYGEQDKMDNYVVRRIEIARSDHLTDEEKRDLLEQAERDLPETARRRRAENRARQDLDQQIKDAREKGATEDEIFQIRAAVIGADKAERHRLADEKRFAWNERVARYRKEREAILNSGAYSPADLQTAIRELRAHHFSERERVRIKVIDRIKDSSRPQ